MGSDPGESSGLVLIRFLQQSVLPLQPSSAKPQRITHDTHGRQRHCGRCDDRRQQDSRERIKDSRLEEQILKDHVGHCVEHAINSGNKAEQRRKIEELMAVVSRADR